jgi:hypothetical protein
MRRSVMQVTVVMVGVSAGPILANDPNPNLVVISDPAAPHVVTAPAFAPRSVPNLAGPPIVAVSGLNRSGGGCESCGAKAGAVLAGIGIGEGCQNPVTCGNWATERTFLFGSCRQFYSPGRACGGTHHWFGLKDPIAYGSGGIGDHTRCEYGSYANR